MLSEQVVVVVAGRRLRAYCLPCLPGWSGCGVASWLGRKTGRLAAALLCAVCGCHNLKIYQPPNPINDSFPAPQTLYNDFNSEIKNTDVGAAGLRVPGSGPWWLALAP